MRYFQHPTNNHVLGAPPGHDQSKLPVGALPVTMGLAGEHGPCIMSFWKPSEDELKQLTQGKGVVLIVYGFMHPPVYIGVETYTAEGLLNVE